MACRRLSVVFVVVAAVLALFGARTLADAGLRHEGEAELEIAVPGGPKPAVEEELERLRSKIASLESTFEDRAQELKTKDDRITQLEKIVQEKSNNLALLQREVNSLQRKKATDAEERAGKAHAQATELKNQVAVLKSKIELQNQQQQAAEFQAKDAEKKAKELTMKMGNLQKLIEKQNSQIQKLLEALQSTEEKIVKVQRHAESKAEELSEVKSAWLPHWIVVQSVELQSFAAKYWKDHGKPAWDIATQKAQENTVKVHEWAKPYIEEINSKWTPVLQEKWVTLSTKVQPHVQTATTKLKVVYEEAKTAVTPHIFKAKEVAEPYLKEIKKVSKPYVDQVATITRPHVDKVRIVLKPYTERAVHAYGKFLKSATTYHQQAQSSVRRTLKEHELTRALATDESVWFMASALLALPILIIYNVCSSLFCKKAQGQSSHTPQRYKRRHPEK